MKGLAFACSLLFATGANAAPVATDDFKERLLEVCLSVASLNATVQHSTLGNRAELVHTINTNADDIAYRLSEPLPQAYSAIRAGLDSIVEYSSLPPRAEQLIADHSAVLGMWCVQDAVDFIINANKPVLQEQDVQVQLIDLYSDAVIDATK